MTEKVKKIMSKALPPPPPKPEEKKEAAGEKKEGEKMEDESKPTNPANPSGSEKMDVE